MDDKIVSKKNIPLWTYAGKIRLISRVGLNAQAGCEDKLTNGSAETGEESVEWLLERSCQHDVSFRGPLAGNGII